MLQQTQVITVIPYFERFVSRFPSVKKLAAATEDQVLEQWAGLGYYSRARNLYRGAKKIVEDLRGRFPKTREGWLEIPGVGPYTAGAILSIAQNEPEAILDGNVERVVSRVEMISDFGKNKEHLWAVSRKWVEKSAKQGIRPSDFNQAMMELGATVCTPKNPACQTLLNPCPIQSMCQAYASGRVGEFPPKGKRKVWKKVEEDLNLIIDPKGSILVRRRGAEEWRSGLWDLVEAPPRQKGFQKRGVIETQHIVTQHKIRRKTTIWTASSRMKAQPTVGAGECRWISEDQISARKLAVGSALVKTLKKVREEHPDLF